MLDFSEGFPEETTDEPTSSSWLPMVVSRVFSGSANPVRSTLLTGPRGAELIERNRNEDVMKVMNADSRNRRCADCSAEIGGDAWASLCLGVFLCIQCCGVHRSLGTHVSQCRSLDLDDWSDEQISALTGNAAANALLEAHVPPGRARPCPTDPIELRAEWIRAKYCEKAFTVPLHIPVSIETYDMGPRMLLLRFGRRLRQVTAVVKQGVLLAALGQHWTAQPRHLMVLEPGMFAVSKPCKDKGPQDRPIDSKSIEIVSADGTPVLQCEAPRASDAAAWLMSLRGSIALGTRCGIRSGWLRKAGAWNTRLRRRWFILHPSGLYYFTVNVGSELPLTAEVGGQWRGMVSRTSVKGIEFLGVLTSVEKILVVTPKRVYTLVSSDDDVSTWLSPLAEWAGLTPTPKGIGR
mmetsp:Transcript_33085/g.72049  ORF Transcript_33085/g.72049 Transcript_33085/m.72049 type:complete len:407 (+) Transcript_33085:67-1287(+)